MLVLIVIWLAVAFVVLWRARRSVRGRVGQAIWLLTCIALFYPPLELIASWGALVAVGNLVGGAEIHHPHEPVDVVGVMGQRSTCDWDCYGLLEMGFEKVAVQISGEDVQGPNGNARYFASDPGLFMFQLAKRNDPRCSSYSSWFSQLGLDTADDVEGSLAANLAIVRSDQCLIARREEKDTAEVNVLRTEVFHQTPLGILREYRTSILANDPTSDLPILLAEDKTFQLAPSLPITRFVARITDVSGFLRYQSTPLKIGAVVAPRKHQN